MRKLPINLVLLAAAFAAGMWTWRTIHFATQHDAQHDAGEKRALVRGLDPNAVYKVAVGDSAARGGPNPKVTIVAFSDFECPYCAEAARTLGALESKYGPDLLLAFKHKPLPRHANATTAAIAAEAARQQGKFWQMHDKLFANQQDLGMDSLGRYARELGLDPGRFGQDLQDPRLKARVKADLDESDRFAVRGTPAFFINGRPLRGAVTAERFTAIIDEEIRKADAKLAAGVPRRDLYAALIMNGKTAAEPTPAPSRPNQ